MFQEPQEVHEAGGLKRQISFKISGNNMGQRPSLQSNESQSSTGSGGGSGENTEANNTMKRGSLSSSGGPVTLARNRRASVMARESFQKADTEINAEVDAALAILNASTDDDELLGKLTEQIVTYSQLKDKAKFEGVLIELHEELVRQIALRREAQHDAQRSAKKMEISGLRFQKDLLQKTRELEEGKDSVSKLKEEISTFKSFTSEGESTIKHLMDNRTSLIEKNKKFEEENNHLKMEMEKSKIDLENEIIKLKSEKSQAMSKLTGTITERKKNQKVVEEEKIKLEEQVHSLSQQVEELMIVKEQKLVVDAKIEQLSTRIAEEGALHKAKINELKDRFSAQVDQLEKSLQSGESKISELQTAAQQSNEEKLQLNSAVNVLNIKIREQEGEIVKARNDYDEIKRKSANAFNEISALTNENGKLRSDREEIKKQREQMLAELKKRDAAVLEARDANEKIISALKKETDTLQKSLVSQKKLFVAQQEEGKKNADTRIQSLQLELNMIKRDYQDVSQLKATISAQTDIHNATVKELKKKVLQLESMNNHLTENLTENTLGKLQSDILSLKNAVNAELKHGLDTVKSMERNNKTLAAEVKRYQKLEMDMIEVGGVDGRISAGEARNHRLERLVDDLESYKGNSSSRPHTAKPSSGVALDNFEKEVVELTQQLLSVNRVCGRSQSMKVLSNRLQKLPTVRTSASRAASAKRTNTTF